jgi:YegS/Rv2252/BmrU family lipid kinase
VERYAFIINPVAGTTDPDDIERLIEEATSRRNISCEARRTRGAGDALKWAGELAAAGGVRLVAVGGDGTLREVVAGVMEAGCDVPVAFVPVGSANIMAEVLGIPKEIEDAIAVALDSDTIPFDVGYVNDMRHCFLIAAGAGLPADVMDASSRPLKRVIGPGAYVLAALRFLPRLLGARRMRLEIDGRAVQTNAHSIVLVNAGRVPGTDLPFVPGASAQDGVLDIAIIEARSPWTLLRRVIALATGDRSSGPRIERGCDIRMRLASDVSFQIDGDSLDVRHPRISVRAKAVSLVAPKQTA